MPIERIPKLEAARVQMDAAAAAYLRGEFIPAITLAAAAEEVIARFLPAGQQSSQDELVARFEREGISAKEARDVYLNASRNNLKHHSDTDQPHIDFDPEADARVWITRALANWGKLGNRLPPNVVEFVRQHQPRSGV